MIKSMSDCGPKLTRVVVVATSASGGKPDMAGASSHFR